MRIWADLYPQDRCREGFRDYFKSDICDSAGLCDLSVYAYQIDLSTRTPHFAVEPKPSQGTSSQDSI